MKKSDRVPRRSEKSVHAVDLPNVLDDAQAPAIFQFAIDELTIDELLIIENDGFISYGRVCDSFHQATNPSRIDFGSKRLTNSSIDHARSAIPASIAGVTRRVE